jgi:methionine transaminase
MPTTTNSEVRSPRLQSRLPDVGTTIFSVISELAQRHGAINLGQGFPDFAPDPALVDALTAAMREGHNQYPPMAGVPALRNAVAHKLALQHGVHYDAGSEITITAGATQAILTAVLCCVHPGDEVIVLEPCYDSYVPAIELAGGRAVRIPPRPDDARPDVAAACAAVGPRTRAVIVNSPHNPSATIWSEAERAQLAQALRGTDVLVISDEVYEHMVFDGRSHASVASEPTLRERSFLVSSFGKTFHVTGWKVGYVAAPAAVMAEFRKVHQFNVFTVHTPTQHALAHHLSDPVPWQQLPAFYQAKRDRFRAGLARTRFKLLPSEGSYFQCVDYSAMSDLDDTAFCEWLIEHKGVAAIPLSPFVTRPLDQRIVRFCFAKRDATLDEAIERLMAE